MNKFRILVVDDEEDVRTILRLALGTQYEVVEAHDGLDALEKLERAEPDFVVLDVMMPLMDGYETCRAIRNSPKFRDLSVLFLSARRSTQAIKDGYGAGATLYLTKPFDPERLVRNIEQYLQESRVKPRAKRFTLEALQAAAEKPAAVARAMVEPPAAAKPAAPSGIPQTPPPVAVSRVEPAAAPPEKPPAGLRFRVMIVDDERDVLDLITTVLCQDFEVTTARDGIEAVEKIILYQPDLVVLDAMLPKMSGYQLCTSLRRNQNYSKTPILFISAKSSPRDQEYCKRLGADDFLAKPFDPEDLRQRLLAYAKAPGFVLRPKKLTLEQIRARESTQRWEKERDRRAEEREREMKGFIDREMS